MCVTQHPMRKGALGQKLQQAVISRYAHYLWMCQATLHDVISCATLGRSFMCLYIPLLYLWYVRFSSASNN
jgi:hypothetical protein